MKEKFCGNDGVSWGEGLSTFQTMVVSSCSRSSCPRSI